MIRHSANPIITRKDVPPITREMTDVSSVFNPGAISIDGLDRLLLRVQTRGRHTRLMVADQSSDNPLQFTIRRKLVEIHGVDDLSPTIFHIYDPRLTQLDGAIHMVFAADTNEGCRLGIAQTTDLEKYELISFDPDGDRRNGVLFDRKIGGRYLRLERPNNVANEGQAATGSEIWTAESDDLVTWKPVAPVMGGRWHYWDELIGPGPPPVLTPEGWLLIYHGVATHLGTGIYQAGVCLLDTDDPSKLLARSPLNVLEPRELYETVGQVPNVVFPSGLILDDDGQSVRVYYGAADTTVCVAFTTVPDLLNACDPVS